MYTSTYNYTVSPSLPQVVHDILYMMPEGTKHVSYSSTSVRHDPIGRPVSPGKSPVSRY